MSSPIPVQRGATEPADEGESLAEVTLSGGDTFGSTTTLRGPFPLAMDGFRWHFYAECRDRIAAFVAQRAEPPIEAVGVTDDERRLRGRVRQLAVAHDAITVYLGPPA